MMGSTTQKSLLTESHVMIAAVLNEATSLTALAEMMANTMMWRQVPVSAHAQI